MMAIEEDAHSILKDTFRGAVLLARQGEILLRTGYGLANEEWRIPNTATTKFRIGSVTKTFTAAAVLRLVESGVVHLQATVGQYLPDLPQTWLPLTIHQLLTHTAGLRDHLAVPAKRTLNRTGAEPRDLVNLIANEPLLCEPGTRCAYSNTGYILLGMLIEKTSNQSYAGYLEENILRPSRLLQTAYDSPSQILPERASGYAMQGGQLRNADYLDMTVPYSAGALISTVDDLLRWNMALHEGSLLSTASYAAMTTRYPEAKLGNDHYGYGLFIGEKYLAHSGGVNGFLAVVQYYPAVRGSMILLSNELNPAAVQPVVEKLSLLLLNED